MLSESDLKEFKEETHRACEAAGGKRLREWIRRRASFSYLKADPDCCCPLLARSQFLKLDNTFLSSTQFWTFANGFDHDSHTGNPLPGHDLYSIGDEFRHKVLSGEYDNFTGE